MLVSDIMNRELVTVTPEENVTLAARLLSRYNVGALPVCEENGHLAGMITDRDIVLRCVAADEDPDRTRVGEIMSRSVITVSPDDEVSRASQLMCAGQVRRLPVVENGTLRGIVSLGDMSQVCGCSMEASRALTEISANLRQR